MAVQMTQERSERVRTGGFATRVAAVVRLLRPRQMTKNLFCFAGVLFSGRFLETRSILAALATFVAFCAASAAVYVLNDLADREQDRLHPRKRNRPLASGAVGVPTAIVLGVLLVVAALGIGFALSPGVFVCVLLYLVNNVAYSSGLKHLSLFDVLAIAFGFVLRLLAGIYAVGELPTTWITLCTFFLSVFLGSCKRRAELARLGDMANQQSQRPVLSKYTVGYLDQLVNNSAAMAVVCYAMFTTLSNKNPSLVITVPIVFFAVMHYKKLVMVWEMGEEPERIVIRDVRLLASGFLWLVTYFAVLHYDLHLFR